MTVKTYYPSTVTQNSAAWIASFTTLNNVKTENNDYAYASVDAKSGTKHTPAKITATNFNVSIPEGAVLNKITVQYKQRKMPSGGHYPALPAPKITLANTGLQTLAGTAPNSSAQVCEKVFSAGSVQKSNVTHQNFGVVLEYQKNTNEYSGELWVYWIRVIVDYTPTTYTISNKVLSGEYNNDVYQVMTTVSNVNKTKYTPTITITAPLGFTFKEVIDNLPEGTFTVINNRTFTWEPPITKNVINATLILSFDTDVSYSTGQTSVTLTYTASESLNGVTKDTSITVKKERPTPTPDTPDTPVNPSETTEMPVPQTIVFPEEGIVTNTFTVPTELMDADGGVITFINADNISTVDDIALNTLQYPKENISGDNTFALTLEISAGFSNEITMRCYDSTLEDYITTDIPVYWADDFDLPIATILEVTGEELNRLGDNIVYTVQSDYTCTTSETYYVPLNKNYHLGVFNNPITSNLIIETSTDQDTGETVETITDTTDYTDLDADDIINNAEYWSGFLQNVNTKLSMECKFVYNENYPLYIIIAGDYPEFEREDDTLTFNTPCIIETEDYTQRITSKPFFAPIQDIITEGISTITLDAYTSGSSFKLYNPNFEDIFGTGDNTAIRGIEIIGDINCNNDATITAKLKSPSGDIGARSIIVGNDAETLSIGGLGDLFGYLPSDLENLNDWLIEIDADNVFPEAVDINITNIQLKVYYVTIDEQSETCWINGEDIAYYGAYLTDLDIPPGLRTATRFLDIDGTDTNDAYSQNIREKTITIECDIGDCSLLDSTNQLRELTKLIINDRDKYNRPIPKRVEFSNYPDLYWEYIIVDTIDNAINISSYDLKIELTIPSGTAFKSEDTIVNNSGYVNGLAAVNPILTVKPTGNTIVITEEETQQKFIITYSNYADDDLYIIDCENRTVHLRKTNASDDNDDIDISSYADFNSDWFTLDNDFIFGVENGILQTVQYTERW